jgi:hypothetical protein
VSEVDLNSPQFGPSALGLRGRRWLAIGGLVLLFGLLIHGVGALSFTFDEPAHVAAGYAFLARGKRGLWTVPLRGHPVLVDAWAAAPVYAGDPGIQLESLDGWEQDRRAYSRSFIQQVDSLPAAETASRVPVALLTVLLGAVVFRWAQDLWGGYTGLWALGLLLFDPTVLGHGRLATNDVGVAALGTLSLYLTWRWSRRPAWLRGAVVGLSLGLTLVAKASGLLYLAVVLVVIVRTMFSGNRGRRVAALSGGVILGLATLVLWAAYGFSVERSQLVWGLPLPAAIHWETLMLQTRRLDEYAVFALGQTSTGRFWWYFPVAFLLKNPVPLLVAVAVSLPWLALRARWRRLWVPGVFAMAYALVAVTQGPNIGYRHLIPVHPTIYLACAGWLASEWRTGKRVTKSCIALMAAWSAVTAARTTPYELSFFNELVGGPSNGWRYLADSNTDWLQGWRKLYEAQQVDNHRFLYAGYEGYTDLASYGVEYDPLTPTRGSGPPSRLPIVFPSPGRYVISSGVLSGAGLADADLYSWFRFHNPVTAVADTLFYYAVDLPEGPTWLAQCDQPARPLDGEAAAVAFGEVNPRRIEFDCTQSWVYPSGGETLGWYALHDQLLERDGTWQRLSLAPPSARERFASRHLAGLPAAYRQREYHLVPAFSVYERTPADLPGASCHTEAHAALAGIAPGQLAGQPTLDVPVSLGGRVDFLGLTVYSQGDALQLETWWQVTEDPGERLYSIAAHLVDGDGEVLEVGDGLGIMPHALQSGDVFVQLHRFEPSLQRTSLWLAAGVYWSDTLERWHLVDASGADTLFLLLDDQECD